MDAKVLMIGDWVHVPHNGNATHYGKVVSLLSSGAVEVELLDGRKALCSSVEPIPLTEEILEKNGFEVYKQDFTSNTVYKFGCFDFIEYDAQYKWFNIGTLCEYKNLGFPYMYIHSLMKIHNVHQLQHALRLCGVEHEIKL